MYLYAIESIILHLTLRLISKRRVRMGGRYSRER